PAIVRPRELDDDRSHRAVVGPRPVGHAGRPQDRLAGGDTHALVVDDHPATALDDDEPGGVRARVGLDPAVPAEGELTDEAPRVAVDDLALDAGRPGRTVGPAMAD